MKRILRTSWQSLVRNGWLTTATILVMTLTLFVIGGLLLLGVTAQVVIQELANKIDIAVYFLPNTARDDIFNVKNNIEGLSEVASVNYISQEQALEEFKGRHQNDAVILASLEEVGGNPLEATINIKTKDSSKLAAVASYLQDKNYPVVDKINYFENQIVIDRLSSIIHSLQSTGLGVIAVLAAIAILVAFNTIRIAIWSFREEIGIMRLVGASAWFIRGPFLVGGVMYGIISGILAAVIFFPVLWVLSPKLLVVIPSIDLYKYLETNILQFVGILTGAGIVLGVISSFFAVRKYLKV